MNCFRINTLAKSWKQNNEGFMLGIAFIVKSFLNKIGSGKTDTSVLFVIFYSWKLNCEWEKKSFFILINGGRSVAKQSSISVCCKKHFCEMLLLIFDIQGSLKPLLPWFNKQVYLGLSFSFSISTVVQNVCGWR